MNRTVLIDLTEIRQRMCFYPLKSGQIKCNKEFVEFEVLKPYWVLLSRLFFIRYSLICLHSNFLKFFERSFVSEIGLIYSAISGSTFGLG